MGTGVTVSAPGRICLFGEHQDFLGLAVIACPIDLTITLNCTARSDRHLAVNFPDLQDSPRDLIHADRLAEYRHNRDYVRSATNVLRREGLHIKQGYDCTVHGTIPINAGTSSSSALVVAWTAFLLATQNGDLPHEREDIARFAHKAEVVEFEEAGGMMDHYASAVGGLLHIDCREPITVTRLPAQLDGFVLGDSGIPKNTVGTLRASRDDTRAGLSILKSHIPDFSLQSTSMEQAEEYFPLMPENVRRRVRANFINRDICREARELLSQPVVEDTARLGRLLYEHQAQLRDGIGVSHPKLDEMLEAAMEAGALGGKLNGSGCGGCMFAYAPGRQQEVKEALERVGNRAFIISMSDGVQVQRD
ncbi:MAG: mevalonate kinase family protein [Armatimonadota bacterium]